MEEKNISSLPHPFRIQRFDTLPSTNTYLSALAREGEGEGLAVVARSQSEGRGRFRRRFYSPEGTGVYMSLLLRPAFSPALFPLLTPLAGVAAAEAAEAVSGRTVGIKWVNDLYLGEKKIAGILAESGISQNVSSSLQNERYIIIGIGINLTLPPTVPDELLGKMGALFESGEAPENAEEAFVATFLSRFAAYYEKMPSLSFMEGYRKRSILIGKTVLLFSATVDGEKQGGGERVTVLNIDGDGALVVKGEDGKERRVSAGEVSLSIL